MKKLILIILILSGGVCLGADDPNTVPVSDPNTADPNTVMTDPNDFALRIQQHNAAKAEAIASYDVLLQPGGYADQLLVGASALVAQGRQIYLDAEAEAARQGLDWQTQKRVLGLIDNHLDRPDWQAKQRMLAILERVITLTRNEMADANNKVNDVKKDNMLKFTETVLELVETTMTGAAN